MSYSRRFTRRAAVAASLLALGACNDSSTTSPNDPGPPPARVVTTITIADPGALTDGDVRPLQASVTDQFGAPMPAIAVQWSVADPAIATVSESGILTALAEGATQLTAAAGSKVASRALVIARHPATRLDLSQPLLELTTGSAHQLTATVRGIDGRPLNGRPITWQVANPAVARVSATGLVTAIAPGQTAVTARHGTVEMSARVVVAGFASTYQVASLDGRALPLIIDEWEQTDDQGVSYRMVERLERGTAQFGSGYDVQLVVGIYRRTTLQGNVIEQRLRQRLVRDRGQLQYNWLDGSARLASELVGSLTHELRPQGPGLQLRFRLGGTDTTWGLSLTPAP